MAAATREFGEHGYHGANVVSIAAAAGVTKVIAYRAFGSKREMYTHLLEHHRDELLAALIDSQTGSNATSDQRVRAGLDAWFAYVEQHPFAWRLLFRDTTGEPSLEELHQRMRTQARTVLSDLLHEHLDVPASAAPFVAEFLRSAIVGVALWWLEHPDHDRQVIVDGAHRLAAGALSAGNQDARPPPHQP